jgi:LEA14-like dessication related protein
MRLSLTILAFAFAVVFASCRQPKNLVYQQVQHVKMNGLGLDNSGITMDVKLYNPNRYGIRVKNADVDIYVNQSYVGKMLIINGNYLIPRTDTFLLPVKVDVDIKNVLPNALRLLFDKTVLVKVTGKIKAGKHGLYVSVPINYEGRHEI